MGILVGALMLTSACGSQGAFQGPASSGGIATLPAPATEALPIPRTTPAGAAVVPADLPTKDQPAKEPPAITVQAEVGYGVGNRVPDFELTLVDGSTFTYQDIISRGEPVFLFFTASW